MSQQVIPPRYDERSPWGIFEQISDLTNRFRLRSDFELEGLPPRTSRVDWTPAELATVKAWFAADEIVGVSNGAALSTWGDLSGNGAHAVSTGADPTYLTSQLVGKPGVYFPHKSAQLNSPFSASAREEIFYAVIIVDSLVTNGTVTNALPGGRAFVLEAATQRMIVRKVSPHTTLATGVPVLPIGVPVLVGYTMSRTAIIMSLNGTSDPPTPHSMNFDPGLGTVIGGFLDGRILELLSVSFTVGDDTGAATNARLIEGYLAHKWGLVGNLPESHPSKYNPPPSTTVPNYDTLIQDLDTLYVQKGAFNAKGDLLVGGANDTYANLPAGTTGQLLSVDPTAIGGLAWSGGETVIATRSLAATANATTEIGKFSNNTGAHNLRVALTIDVAGFSAAKTYDIATQFLSTGSGWRVWRPASDSGSDAADDFELLVWPFGVDTTLKLRRVGSGTNTTPITVRIWNLGTADAFTAMTAASTDATVYPGSLWTAAVGDILQSKLAAPFVGTDVATAQPIFPAAQDALTLPGGTVWGFDALYALSRSAGAVSHTVRTLFGGTANFTDFFYSFHSTSAAAGGTLAAVNGAWANAATAFDVTAASTVTTEFVTVLLRGSFTVNAGGTIIPQIQFSAAPGGAPTFQTGSTFRCWYLGRAGFVFNGRWG